MPREAAEQIVLMVAPLAPHIAEELWMRLGTRSRSCTPPFPVADPALLVEDTVTCVVQVRGKVRDRLEVPADITEDALRELALASAKVQAAVPDGIRTVDRPGAQARQRRPRLSRNFPARSRNASPRKGPEPLR